MFGGESLSKACYDKMKRGEERKGDQARSGEELGVM